MLFGLPMLFVRSSFNVNDETYGLSLLLLGHDSLNFDINEENSEHIYMEFDARGGFRDTSIIDWRERT